jgi:hypothetical protein
MRACGIVLGIRVAGARPDLVDAEEVLTYWSLGWEFSDESCTLDWKPKRLFPLVAELDTGCKNLDPFTAAVVVFDILAIGYAREEYAGRAFVCDVEAVVVRDGSILWNTPTPSLRAPVPLDLRLVVPDPSLRISGNEFDFIAGFDF